MNLRDEFFIFSAPAGAGEKHWAGAQRPKAETADKNLTWQPRRATDTSLGMATPHGTSKHCGKKILGGKNLSLKLREQAKKLGLIPGSPRWRAYVLGTPAAMRKRKREKRKKGECGGYVTPPK